MPKRDERLVLEAFENSLKHGFAYVEHKGKTYEMTLRQLPSKEESLKKIDETTDKLLKRFKEEFGGKQ